MSGGIGLVERPPGQGGAGHHQHIGIQVGTDQPAQDPPRRGRSAISARLNPQMPGSRHQKRTGAACRVEHHLAGPEALTNAD
nr:hypothetical protein [Candidatus Microthrix sp.]